MLHREPEMASKETEDAAIATEKRAKRQRKAVEKAAKKAEASTTAKRSSAK
jgi:hypothetical protein